MANPFQLHSQIEIEIRDLDKPFFMIFDSLASGLDTSVIPGGILYNRVIPWSNLEEWRDEDTITTHRFFQAWWDLEMSNVHNITADKYNEIRDTLSLRALRGQLTVPVIRYNFAYFDSLSFENGYFHIVDGIITDTGADPEPYYEKEVVLAALVSGNIYAETIYDIVYDSELFLSNSGLNIEEITLTNLTDHEYVVLTPTSTETFNFRDTGMTTIELKLKFDDQIEFTLYQRVMVLFKPDGHPCDDPEDQVLESDIPYQGAYETVKTTSLANFQIFYRYQEHSNECEHLLQKPIILLDGYDAQDKRDIADLYKNYLKYGTNDNIGKDLRHLGFDIIVLNFPVIGSEEVKGKTEVRAYNEGNQFLGNVNREGRDGGTDYIQRNAMLLVKLIQQVNDSLQYNNSEEQIVVIGPSMGGLVSRYALAYMEKQHENEVPDMEHNTRLWISFDSPHLGANIPIANQQLLAKLAKLGSQASLESYKNSVFNPAGRQLLIEQLNPVFHANGALVSFTSNMKNTDPLRASFMSELLTIGLSENLGYPSLTRNISLVNGTGNGVKSNIAGSTFIDLDVGVHIPRLSPLPPLLVTIRLQNKYLGNYNTFTNTNSISLSPFPFPFSLNLNEYAYNVNPSGSMDVVPGGLYNSNQIIRDEIEKYLSGAFFINNFIYSNWNVFKSNHTFIPTISSLDFLDPDFNWSERVDNRHLVCEGEISFDNYFLPSTNEAHVFLTPESAAWVTQEILKGEKECPTICSFEITGADRVCTGQNETYTLDVSPPSGVTTDWSVSGTLSIVSQNNNSVTVSSTGYNQNSKIFANFENPCGADPPQISKSVISGTGIMGIGFEPHAVCYYQAVASIVNDDYTYEWSLNNIHFTSTLPPLEHTYAPGGGFQAGYSQDVYLKWESSCGQDTKHVLFNESQNPSGCSWRPEHLDDYLSETKDILIYPNPAEGFITMEGSPQHEYTYSIYDVFGRLMVSDVFVNTTTVSTSGFSKGVYVVLIHDVQDASATRIKLFIH